MKRAAAHRSPPALRPHPMEHAETIRPPIAAEVSLAIFLVKLIFSKQPICCVFCHILQEGTSASMILFRSCQNVLGFLLTLRFVNVQCHFSAGWQGFPACSLRSPKRP
jgi:hypothetical protein